MTEVYAVKAQSQGSHPTEGCYLGTINPHFTPDCWYQLHVITSLSRHIHTVKQPHLGSLFGFKRCSAFIEVTIFNTTHFLCVQCLMTLMGTVLVLLCLLRFAKKSILTSSSGLLHWHDRVKCNTILCLLVLKGVCFYSKRVYLYRVYWTQINHCILFSMLILWMFSNMRNTQNDMKMERRLVDSFKL